MAHERCDDCGGPLRKTQSAAVNRRMGAPKQVFYRCPRCDRSLGQGRTADGKPIGSGRTAETEGD